MVLVTRELGRVAHIVLALCLAACGRGGDPAPARPQPAPSDAAMTAPRHWRVFDGDTAILDVTDRPGPITSTAPPPPGGTPVMHPFLSAAALDAGHEDRLHTLLVAAHSLDEFLKSLTAAGYRVVEQK
jgi:hypothetical protein